MDDDVLDGQQPEKREEVVRGAGRAWQPAIPKEGKKEAASSSSLSRKLPRALKYDVVGGDFSRVSHVAA